MRLLAVLLAGTVTFAGCWSQDGSDREMSDLPTDVGPLPTGSVTWATGDTIQVGDRTIAVGKRVRAMVGARGRIYYLTGRSETLWVTDGEESRRTGYKTSDILASHDGRYLGFFEQSQGPPWSTVVVDLSSGEVVVDDAAGMGDADDDLADLYADAEPHVLGFEGDEFYVRAASGAEVLSWDAGTGERTSHGLEWKFFFGTPDPGGGRELPALVRRGRLVLPDPWRSTQRGHESPDGTLAIQPVGNGTAVFAIESGEELPTDLKGRHFAQRHCQVLHTIRPPRHELILFPTGSAASYA